MASTTFVDFSPATPIVSAWLNDVNNVIYNLLGNGTLAPGTLAQLLANLGLVAGGPTANRPAHPQQFQSYFDTNLGFPIWCSQVNPAVVWVTASGVAV